MNKIERKQAMKNKFFDAYIECALWASIGDDDEPLDQDYGPEDRCSSNVKRSGDCFHV